MGKLCRGFYDVLNEGARPYRKKSAVCGETFAKRQKRAERRSGWVGAAFHHRTGTTQITFAAARRGAPEVRSLQEIHGERPAQARPAATKII